MKKKDGFIGQIIKTLPQQIIEDARQNPILSSLFVTDIGYYPHAQGHYRERPDGCEQNILIYCIEGKGWIEADGRKTAIGKNEYFTIPAHNKHRYGADQNDPWSIYWLHFIGEKARFFLNVNSTEIHRIDTPESSRYRERIFLFLEIVENLQQGPGTSSFEYASTCLWHLLGSFRFVTAYRKIKQVKTADKVEKSIYYMNEQIDKKLSLSALASQCGLSVSHYCLVFKKHTSYSPLVYFARLKVQKACNLLDFTAKSIKEISHIIGFEDQYYFTRVFSKIMGIPPTAYRIRKKG